MVRRRCSEPETKRRSMHMSRRTNVFAAALCAAALGLGVVAVLPSQRAIAGDAKMADMAGKKDIIETATGPGMQQVTTVVTAIKAADLVDALKGDGPFTVFAPTNAAFNKLPAGTVDDLLKPANKEKLKTILLYHVHPGDAIMAKDVKTMKLSTAEGKDLDVKVENGTV